MSIWTKGLFLVIKRPLEAIVMAVILFFAAWKVLDLLRLLRRPAASVCLALSRQLAKVIRATFGYYRPTLTP